MTTDTKVRKARARGRCPLCRGGILVGQQIGNYPQIRGWVHVDCPGRRCEHCNQRIPLTRIAQGFTAHPTCQDQHDDAPRRTTPMPDVR